MQCQHRGLLGQCGNKARSEGLCNKHVLECDSKNCFEPAAKKYCRLHECAADKCYERRTDTGEYCAKHGCTGTTAKSKHCGAERKKGKYCLEHACAMGGCNSERGPGGECRAGAMLREARMRIQKAGIPTMLRKGRRESTA